MKIPTGARMTSWTDVFGNPVQCIRRDQRQLVGISHQNKLGQSRMDLIRTLECGTSLTLVPEPNNKFDRNAILVHRTDMPNSDLGYMDATGAKKFCKLMERGATFSAQVSWINSRTSYPEIYFYIFQLSEPTIPKRPVSRNAIEYKGNAASKRRATNPLVERTLAESDNAVEITTTTGIWRRILAVLIGKK